jgi:2-amino-4-hydroxy-6-hydroxymethyldihydropteridine diphosphokinase
MIILALGSNIAGPWGSPREAVERALLQLKIAPLRMIRSSSLIETAPFGNLDQPSFVNAVANIKTKLEPIALLSHLHTIEKAAGRERIEHWGPRTLDLDILDYNGLVINLPTLTLPHPGIAERNFVLQPLNQIAPTWRHPLTQETAASMIQKL